MQKPPVKIKIKLNTSFKVNLFFLFESLLFLFKFILFMKDSKPDFGIYSSRILTGNGLFAGTMLVKDGVISKLLPGKTTNTDFPLEDLNDLVVMPGIIDSHVHINEPGRTDWEGFETMTQAALAGGITTLVDMPLNATPVTTSRTALDTKIAATNGKLYCNVGFWGGVVPDNLHQLEELIQAGVLGIKAFMTHSGIDDFPNVTKAELEKALEIMQKYRVPLLAHAELDEHHAGIDALAQNPTSYPAYLNSRPKKWEDDAVLLMIELCEKFNTPVHIVHLSSANTLPQIKAAREKGLPLTVETCPQYLYYCAEEIPDANTLFKCAPPIRERENNEKLWQGIRDGIIDFVVTDHSPATPDIKQLESGNLKLAWGGIASIQFSLPVVWTAAQKRGFSLENMAALLSKNVANFIGYSASKGQIAEGYDADLVVWNPEAQFTVSADSILYRHKISPYVGEVLSGMVHQTYLGGKKVFENGKIIGSPLGNLLKKP